ncbi:hypothetical protein H0A36_13675 [Endozoicomonas sp. SM1973]|uniref:Uncharacterized protein n=1 Tax=Spartinivicinus marinus TaxID=2994442 RepID=A0A853IAK4_9GAMM|nr:hypothetical protein [Spartinivicinus marinus]MCX4027070.1 hypothetical protein [Spartinivicinus marinus]NYZ67064.1 hypothetical protein [Spartinivicinus marinus]
MKPKNKITKVMQQRSTSSSSEYNSLVSELISLDQRIFNHDKKSKSLVDKVFKDKSDDDNIACIIYRGVHPIGYCFIKVIYTAYNNKPIRLLQGIVGSLPGNHGSNLIFPTYLKLCTKFLFDFWRKTYAVGFITNPALYGNVAKFSYRCYPSLTNQDSSSDEAIILYKAVKLWNVIAIKNTNSPYFITEDLQAIDTYNKEPRNQEEAFFFKYNPKFRQGNYLGFCTRFSLFRMLQCITYLGLKRILKSNKGIPSKSIPQGSRNRT